MKVTLKIFEAEKHVLTRVLSEGEYRIGRSDTCEIILKGESLSRKHVELRVTGVAIYMTNLSGSGRVLLNGLKNEAAELQNGDEVSFGPFKMLVYHGEREEGDEPKNLDFPREPVPDAFGIGEIDLSERFDKSLGSNRKEPQRSISAVSKRTGSKHYSNSLLKELQVSQHKEPSDEQIPGHSGSPKKGNSLFEDPPVQEAVPPISPLGSLESPGAVVPVSEGTSALSVAETQVQVKPLVARLCFLEGPKAGGEVAFDTYEVTFGRSKKADIFIDDERLSRLHAKVSRVGAGYRLIDLNSHNGTYVNGIRILEHPLASFDVITIGNSKIKFLIQEIVQSQEPRAKQESINPTDTLQLNTEQQNVLQLELQQGAPPGGGVHPFLRPVFPFPTVGRSIFVPFFKIIFGTLVAVLLFYFVWPSKKPERQIAPTVRQDETQIKMPPALPKEYLELSQENQRLIQGYYESAVQFAQREAYEDAIVYLKKIHEQIPYFKQSRDLLEEYNRKLKEIQILEAQESLKRDDKNDLQIYLEEGIEYLRVGDFDRAAESFNSAIAIEPNNGVAKKGIKAAEYKIKDINQVPPDRDQEEEKKEKVKGLFQKALMALYNKSYQEAINYAEEIRTIDLKGNTAYLNEAKQIIDRARMAQNEEFEPFLIQANEKYAEGDYSASRDLCEEMLKRDAAYDKARECSLKAKKKMHSLAKEAYTHGYILESMNKIDEAKQYWSRAKNYVRPGDEYYDKVNKKLDQYQ